MKELKLTVVFILFLNLFASAQQWALNSSMWYIGIIESYFSSAQGYEKIIVVGDTTIDGHLCKIMQGTKFYSDGTVNPSDQYYMYSENGKVFHYLHDAFYTLYDFNAMPGDSWYVAAKYPNFCPTVTYHCDTLIKIIVDSVSSILIQNKQFKTLYVHSDSSDWMFNNPIIEGIGSYGGLFPFLFGWLDVNIPYLRCYQDSAISYQAYNILETECDSLVSSLGNITLNAQFKIFPNPINTIINIELGDNYVSEVIISDLTSRVVINEKFIKSISLSADQLAKGIYLYEVKNRNGLVYNGKLIKN